MAKVWIPASKWKAKGPQSISARIRQKKSKKVKVVRKGAAVAVK